MMGYASRTATKRNIAALKGAGWGWIVGPIDQRGDNLHGMPHCLDNGEWSSFINKTPWDERAFAAAVSRFGPTADFIVCPDVVADRDRSLERTGAWLPILLNQSEIARTRILIAVQNGMTPDDVLPLMTDRVGLFVGGDSEWKESSLPVWGAVARDRECHLHVGRVNTVRRIYLCGAAGADSFDGTSATRFAKSLWTLNLARQQSDMFGGRK